MARSDDGDLVSEEIELRTSDGVRLVARSLRHRGHCEVCAVVVHGFSASHDNADVLALAGELHSKGYDALTYSARGHAGSEGWCGVGSTEHLDVACAVHRASAFAPRVVLVGVSMGAVAVVNYLAAPDVPSSVLGAVVVSAPARWRMSISAVGLLTAGLTRTRPGRWLAARKMGVRVAPRWRVGEPLEVAIKRVALPVAIVHGKRDRLLSGIHGQRLWASAVGPTRLDLVAGMGHGIDASGRMAVVEAIRWLTNLPLLAPTTTQGL